MFENRMILNRKQKKTAFTLIEILTVIAILALLLSILTPALLKAKRQAMTILSSVNQREVARSVSCYAADQDSKFPESVATLGAGTRWSWREPTVLTGFQKRSPVIYRSVSQYMGGYIEKASTMFCPSAPSKYKFAQQAWEAGDAWDNPEPDTSVEDPLFGNYCLYWNYIGYLEEKNRPFFGPRSTTRRKTESSLLISDYFGYGHWRNELTYGSRNAYGSCEKLTEGDITSGTSVACDFWSLFNPEDQIPVTSLNLTLQAGYIDGHVKKFSPADTMAMKVSMTPDGQIPYPDNLGPAGTIYIPRDSW
jgi:prepilin-type N-terminal cleavage/methylation domain-containing protein